MWNVKRDYIHPDSWAPSFARIIAAACILSCSQAWAGYYGLGGFWRAPSMTPYLYVADSGNNRIEKFTLAGQYVGQLGCASGACTASSANGQFNWPNTIAIDSTGDLWVVDSNNNRVEKLDSNGHFLLGIGAGYQGVAGTIGSAGAGNGQFSQPYDIAFDFLGNIWIFDNNNNRIQEFSSSGAYISQFSAYSPQGAIGMTFDLNGFIWWLQQVAYGDPAPMFQCTTAGVCTSFNTLGMTNSFGSDFMVRDPSSANLWVTDEDNGRVIEFNESGEIAKQFPVMNAPTGLAIDSSGNVWVTTEGENYVQEYSPSGAPMLAIGTSGSGSGANGQFSGPQGMTFATPYALAFTTAVQSMAPSTCSGVTTLQIENRGGQATKMSADTTVALGGQGLEFFSDPSCSTQLGLPSALSSSWAPDWAEVVGLWHLDDAYGSTTVADSSGNGNTGTVSGDVTLGVPGQIGTAASLDGSTASIAIPDTGALMPSAVTVSAWIYPTSYETAWARVVDKTDVDCTDPGGGYDIEFNPNWDGNIQWLVWNGDNTTAAVTESTIPLNQWTHIVGTFDGSTSNFYVNGELQDTESGTMTANSVPVRVGAESCAGYFPGRIDEVAIWNTALTQAQVQALYEAQLSYNPTVTIPAGSSSANFYFESTADVSSTLAAGYWGATATQTWYPPVGTVAITSPDRDGTTISDLAESSVPVSGTCAIAGGTITITGSASGTATCQSNGTWSTNLDFSSAADGTVSISAVETSSRGTSGAGTRSFNKSTAYCANSTHSSASPFAGGSGTSGSPYLICTTAQLMNFTNNSGYWGNSFQLQNDVDLTGQTWTPVAMTGNFDGDGFVVKNLTISLGSTSSVGFFTTFSGSTLKNLGIVNANITGGYAVGIMAGTINAGTASGIYTTGTVTGTSDHEGGISGETESGVTLSNSWSSANVSGGVGIGGLVGHNYGATISGCYATGTVNTGDDWAGGLTGVNDTGGVVTNSYATGAVYAGGSLGGGLVGVNNGSISTSFATGAVSGTAPLGGLSAQSGGTSSTSYWDAITTGQPTSADGSPLSDTAMRQQSSFTGFDFTTPVWTWNSYLSPYPVLNWQ